MLCFDVIVMEKVTRLRTASVSSARAFNGASKESDTGILNWAETAAVTNDPTHVESIKDSSEAFMDDEYLLYEVEMKPGKGVLFVTQNLSVEMPRLRSQRLHINSNGGTTASFFGTNVTSR
jgi:hypothetical protein